MASRSSLIFGPLRTYFYLATIGLDCLV